MIADSLPWVTCLAAFVVGGILAAFTTTGLWWTVRRLPESERPFRLYAVSVLIRLTVVLIAFGVVLFRLDGIHLLVALAGFSIARLVLVSSVTSPAERQSHE